MFKEELKKYVETSGLVNMKEAGDGIYVLKYKKKVFYDNLWNEYIAECRGTIVDADFNLVTYPFTKIYNYGIEKEAPMLTLDTSVTAFRKVNGFMVSITWHNNDLLISTTGSTESDFVSMAREMIDLDQYRKILSRYESHTFMFECVHPNDPHIIPEEFGMYLLGYRVKSWKSAVETEEIERISRDLGCRVPEKYDTTMGNLLQSVKNVKHEGYVFYTEDGVSAKIKSPYYLTSKWVARNPRTDKLMDLNKDIKHNIDEEYYGLIDAIRLNIEAYTAMNEQERLEWVRNHLETV
jgi:hypothetical protein